MVEELPEGAGRPLSRVPYGLKLGGGYAMTVRQIRSSEKLAIEEREEKLLAGLTSLLQHVYRTIPFYRRFYERHGFHPGDIQRLSDWAKVPIVTKGDLQTVLLEDRTAKNAKGMKVNTGGTSGQPLEFYLDSGAFAREWAHMHFVWKARGYHPRHLKLTFRGKYFQSSQVIRYNAVHNEYVVNANAPMFSVVEAVFALSRKCTIRWVHGYPSLIAEFAHQMEAVASSELARFRSGLFGVLLASEYPAPAYRTIIERELSTNVVSWYGHSEMAVLARETAHGVYESLPTYGYAEAVPQEQAGDCHLVSTSLHNRIHPFVRYDTGDLIKPLVQHAGSLAFRISEGRVGDFVTDRNGERHSLTAIIFGRHHRAFEHLQHLQVRQDSPGAITLLATPKDPRVAHDKLWEGFDLVGLDMDWKLEIRNAPVRTPAGKIQLKVASEM